MVGTVVGVKEEISFEWTFMLLKYPSTLGSFIDNLVSVSFQLCY